jgi:trehalose 6-phosphate synthase
VLILSEFAGAAHQLGCDGAGAVLVNPHSPDALASAIRRALDMPLAERKSRYQAMIGTVRDDNVRAWTSDFCSDLAAEQGA